MKALGAVVRDRRGRLGLTQEELADRMAEAGDSTIRQSDVSRIERGQVQLPRLERLTCLSRALEMSVGELFVQAGWLEEDETLRLLPDDEGDPEPEPPEQPSVEPAGRSLRTVDHPPPPAEGTDSQSPSLDERFEQNRAAFEESRELYKRAKIEYERRQANESNAS